MSVELQRRDMEVLKCVFEQRALSYDQIQRHFFSGRTKSVPSSRLMRLWDEGLVGKECRLDKNLMSRYFVPTAKGFAAGRSSWRYWIDNPHFKSESIDHDIRAAEVALKFKKLKCCVEYLPENLLQSSAELKESQDFGAFVRIQSDAALVLRGKTGGEFLFGLEVELSTKTAERYKAKLSHYYIEQRVNGFFYICGNQSVANAVAKADEELRGDKESRLHTALEKDVISPDGQVILYERDGSNILLQ